MSQFVIIAIKETCKGEKVYRETVTSNKNLIHEKSNSSMESQVIGLSEVVKIQTGSQGGHWQILNSVLRQVLGVSNRCLMLQVPIFINLTTNLCGKDQCLHLWMSENFWSPCLYEDYNLLHIFFFIVYSISVPIFSHFPFCPAYPSSSQSPLHYRFLPHCFPAELFVMVKMVWICAVQHGTHELHVGIKAWKCG